MDQMFTDIERDKTRDEQFPPFWLFDDFPWFFVNDGKETKTKRYNNKKPNKSFKKSKRKKIIDFKKK